MHLIKLKEPKAYLFSNSEFTAEAWNTKLLEIFFWEESLHGYYKEKCRDLSQGLTKRRRVFNNLARTAILRQTREGKSYYFKPILSGGLSRSKEITAYTADGNEKIINPVKKI